YRELHLLATTPPDSVAFYSAAWARAYDVNRERAAASITDAALHGFDFPAVVKQAHQDGVRLFVELGPQASCTRMIDKILDNRPYFAKSADRRGEDGVSGVLRLLGALIAERVPVDLDVLYGRETRVQEHLDTTFDAGGKKLIRVPVGGEPFDPPP